MTALVLIACILTACAIYRAIRPALRALSIV